MERDPQTQDQDVERETPLEGDSSDVVDGAVGDAHLVDPTDAERLGADLDALPAIDDKEPDSGPPDGMLPVEVNGPNH
ncbi:MAG: hypothetical protein ACJ779_02885 [Chloroflexota bacterium]